MLSTTAMILFYACSVLAVALKDPTENGLEERSTTGCAIAAGLVAAGVVMCAYGVLRRDTNETIGKLVIASEGYRQNLLDYEGDREVLDEITLPSTYIIEDYEVVILKRNNETVADAYEGVKERSSALESVIQSQGLSETSADTIRNVFNQTLFKLKDLAQSSQEETLDFYKREISPVACGLAMIAMGCTLCAMVCK